jgi:hypothetical protein
VSLTDQKASSDRQKKPSPGAEGAPLPDDAQRAAGTLHLQEALRLADLLVGALRRGIPGEPPIGSGQAVLALLFAAARVHRLRGGGVENFVETARILWGMSVTDEEAERAASKRKDR